MTPFLFALIIVLIPSLLSWPLGHYMHRMLDPAQPPKGLRGKLENAFVTIPGRAVTATGGWKRYMIQLLVFNAVMFVFSFLVMATQQHLPLNPDGHGRLTLDLIFNTAASFTTNTNLQHYSGEQQMSHFTQLFALMGLQFVSAATGIAALAAVARGLAGRTNVGNFFVDLQRVTFLILLPLASFTALLLLLGGTPMTLQGAAEAVTLEGAVQRISRGPVAAFASIKQLGTNGGGFFGPNSTHPFENPNMFTNVIHLIAILLVPMACVWLFGHIIKARKHAAVIFGVMCLLLGLKLAGSLVFDLKAPSVFAELDITHADQNMEGKELRFGPATGPVWAVLTTSTSNGSVGAMQNSLQPLSGLMALTGMWLNSTFGGVGVGMIGMLIYLVIAVFVAGLMVGRTPEYLGRKIEAREIKLAAVALIAHPMLILLGTALFTLGPWGTETVNNPGPRGFTEILYEFSSAAQNNGSGFEGLDDDTPAWNISTGLVMLAGRFIPMLLPLAIAGSLASKKAVSEGAGTLRTDGLTFGLMLFATIVFVGALTFLPVAMLGPIAEHLLYVR